MTTEDGAWQTRTFGRDVLETQRRTATLEEIVPGPRPVRLGTLLDPELKRQILENGGLYEPLLVEPHPQVAGKLRIVDGERRLANCKDIVRDLKAAGAPQEEMDRFRKVPVEVTRRSLTEEERLRIWVQGQRQGKEWTRREREMVAASLSKNLGRGRAASLLGCSVRELDRMVTVYSMATRLTGLRDPAVAITWAREICNVSSKYRPPEVEEALLRKVNRGMLASSKEVRELRRIVPDEVAVKEFLSERGTIASALARMAGGTRSAGGPGRGGTAYGQGMAADILAFAQQLGRYSWEDLGKLRGDQAVLNAVDEAQAKLARLRDALQGPA